MLLFRTRSLPLSRPAVIFAFLYFFFLFVFFFPGRTEDKREENTGHRHGRCLTLEESQRISSVLKKGKRARRNYRAHLDETDSLYRPISRFMLIPTNCKARYLFKFMLIDDGGGEATSDIVLRMVQGGEKSGAGRRSPGCNW